MNQFQPTSLNDCWRLQNIYEIALILQRHREHLLLKLFEYRSKKQYKEEGFGTFKEAYSFLKIFCNIDIRVTTLWKYFGLLDTYISHGYSATEIIPYAISRLIALRPCLFKITPEMFHHIIMQNKAEFEDSLSELKENR